MRTLSSQEMTQIAGAAAKVVVDVNVPAKYVHINLVDGSKVVTLVNVDWSHWGKPAQAA